MSATKGIMFCGDVVLNAANSYTEEVEFETTRSDWSGEVNITVWAKTGTLTLGFGEETITVPVDSFSGYSGVLNARAIPGITLTSTTDATARVLVELL